MSIVSAILGFIVSNFVGVGAGYVTHALFGVKLNAYASAVLGEIDAALHIVVGWVGKIL